MLGAMAASRLGRGQGILPSGNGDVTMLLEAEAFENRGGWVVDQQCMDAMGSPFLLAHGIGEPVDDASHTVRFPRSGEYRVWVRTRNWVGQWDVDEAPGQFRVLVNGKPLKPVFGAEGAEWHWQNGGTVQVEKGETEVTLHDLTGFEGRCDAIVFTTNLDFRPPRGGQELADFRKEALGLPGNPPSAGDYDLVVVGGGIAGTAAAIVAARLGVKTALIQDRPVLGGNNSSEIRVHALGRVNLTPYPKLGNVVKEIGAGPDLPFPAAAEVFEDDKIMNAARAEQNLDLFMNMHAVSLRKEGDSISSIVAKHTIDSTEKRFSGSLFADCTGDGTIGFLADADFRMGRESKAQTGESMAPEKADKMTMGCTLPWLTEQKDKPVDFPECPWAIQFTEASARHHTKSSWRWEAGWYRHMVNEFEHIRDYELRAIYGNWDFLKNRSKKKDRYARRKMNWLAYVAGKRESRRLLGDVILNQLDVEEAKAFPDACVTATWGLDIHYPHPKNAERFGEPFWALNHHPRHKPYPIPYRCLYSRNVDNMFMAGRDISVTHVALGTTRVMRTSGMMGEVLGMASSLCKEHGVLPRGIYHNYLSDLKTFMKEGRGLYEG